MKNKPKKNPRKGVTSSKAKPKQNEQRKINPGRTQLSAKQKGGVKSKLSEHTRKHTSAKQTKSGSRNTVSRSKPEAKGGKKIITAAPIELKKDAIAKLRKTVRKADGTFFSKEYYEKLLKKTAGKTQGEVDDVLINLRNKNPKLRYFVESKSDTLHFQTGSFVDRLSGKIQTVQLKKGKRKGKAVKTGDLKKGTKIIITDFFGDEKEFNSVANANEVLKDQNNVINNIIQRLQRESKLPKGKKIGVYVTVPETVISNSEGEVVTIKYDYSENTVQGIDRKQFDIYLDDELDNLRNERQDTKILRQRARPNTKVKTKPSNVQRRKNK